MEQFEDCIMDYQCFIRALNSFAFDVAPSCPCAATTTQGPVLFIAPGPELAIDRPGNMFQAKNTYLEIARNSCSDKNYDIHLFL